MDLGMKIHIEDSKLHVNWVFILELPENTCCRDIDALVDVLEKSLLALEDNILGYELSLLDSLLVKSRICHALDKPDSIKSLRDILDDLKEKKLKLDVIEHYSKRGRK